MRSAIIGVPPLGVKESMTSEESAREGVRQYRKRTVVVCKIGHELQLLGGCDLVRWAVQCAEELLKCRFGFVFVIFGSSVSCAISVAILSDEKNR